MRRAAALLVCVCALPRSFAAEEESVSSSSSSSCGRTWSSPRHSTIDQALIFALCQPSQASAAALPYLRPPRHADGFFGQVNSFSQQLLSHLYAGEALPPGGLHKHIYEAKLGVTCEDHGVGENTMQLAT